MRIPNVFVTTISVVGLLIALAGLGVDYLLPDASPGLNIPQLLVVAGGLVLAVLPKLLNSWAGFPQGSVKAAGLAIIITVLTCLVLEIVLTLAGLPTYFPSQLPKKEYKVLSYTICDERGCRLNYERILDLCANGDLTGRKCKVNRQGYADSEDFLVSADYAERKRILTLGDSFAQGFSANLGKSYVETLEANFQEAVVWNAGLTTTGTKQALAAFRELAPILQPQLTVLGFYMNDFADNIIRDRDRLQLQDSGGNLISRPYFQHDRWGNSVDLPAELVYIYSLNGSNPPTSELERLTGLTRLGSLTLRILDGLGERLQDKSLQRPEEATRHYLRELRDAAADLDSQLLVILVPRFEDLREVSDEHKLAIALLEELAIPYMPTLHLLDSTLDYELPPDIHWNNSGHQKVGAILVDCVNEFIASADISNCAHVTMPRN